ncbi:hypothetical protein H0H81_009599 [Sphagnurus paluster]|uniref:Redoxin domain-containing protein n=1 Tax=Sphagnurus paluster TaxID=117069 RepID=A0A9P7FVF6_9AGAR|nr:hypothetical protein H0H81_009599 [Sphagnurus paluster]
MSGRPPTPILPDNLPIPIDDGACAHLTGTTLPSIAIPSTASSGPIDLSVLKGLVIIFCFPRTGAQDEVVPREWDLIPGARGCTPHACSFGETSTELHRLGVQHIFGYSTQEMYFQKELKEMRGLPYELLSDEGLDWVMALGLPTLEWQGRKLVKRLALAVRDGKVVKTWYPIFPPNKNAQEVIAWLKDEGSEE